MNDESSSQPHARNQGPRFWRLIPFWVPYPALTLYSALVLWLAIDELTTHCCTQFDAMMVIVLAILPVANYFVIMYLIQEGKRIRHHQDGPNGL